jgi:ATP-dependent Clp protease ATP-binding subunit ClpC
MENFSEAAKLILSVKSLEVSKQFKSSAIEPEHIALAILKNADTTILETKLVQFGTSSDAISAILEELIDRGTSQQFNRPEFSKESLKVIDSARNEAKIFNRTLVTTEHLFLATMLDTEGVVHVCLEKFGIFPETFRTVLSDKSYRDTSGKQQKEVFTRNLPASAVKVSVLESFCRNLTQLAKEGKIEPVIGREKEIQRLLRILCRKVKNNPALIGEAGVGKTAIVEGAAIRIAAGKAPDFFKNKQIFSLDLTAMLAGSRYRGDFEERMQHLLLELRSRDDAILFIDELHVIVGAGSSEGALDAGNIFKPALSRGEIQCIGATTVTEYHKYIEKDSALERRFQTIMVEEPSREETMIILRGIKSSYEQMHHIEYDDQALFAAIELACRYLPDRRLPDKAIDLLDEAGAQKKLELYRLPAELDELEQRLIYLENEINLCIKNKNPERAYYLQDELTALSVKIKLLKDEHHLISDMPKAVVTMRDIERIISEITGIPEKSLNRNQLDKIMNLEKELKATVIGQKEAVKSVCASIRRSFAGIASPHRPLASFLFTGPTGVGKTFFVKKLAQLLFENENALIRIDMSEYSEKHNISRLIGAPPGYVGHEDGTHLTERIRKHPYSVILFDEIEKAHADVYNILLQILDEGQLEDGLGRRVNFRNTLIIMTSNAGSRDMLRSRAGFGHREESLFKREEAEQKAMEDLKTIFSPEFLNRIDDIICFNALSREDINEILEIQLREITRRLLKERLLKIAVSASAKEFLSEKAYDAFYGARHLQRILRREFEEPLAYEILKMKGRNAELKVKRGKDGLIVKADISAS